MLNHIGITIKDVSEIKNFYQDLLGLKIVKKFKINSELSERIFQINKETDVFLMQKNNLTLELFINEKSILNRYDHICISVRFRDNLIKKAKSKNYTCIIIPREKFNLVFIKDKSGNVFEAKEK